MTVRFSKPFAHVLLPVGLGLFLVPAAACSDDPPTGVSAQVKKFCADLYASSAFSCCSAADRQDRQFSVRNGFGTSAAECESLLNKLSGDTQGRSRFDDTAASSCLSHLSGRTCGVLPSATVRAAEGEAGCNRIIEGTQAERQACNTSRECKAGLVCPPPRATGGSTCVPPAKVNQVCAEPSTSSTAVDHPACEKGAVCQFFQDNPGCAAPPCPEYRCVPFAVAGEVCQGLECAKGLACREGICNTGDAGSAGQACKIFEHCAAGLYCDTGSGTCTAQKSDGAACSANANALFECKGVCKQRTDGSGTCAAFCGSD
jgi:hypothetical protein